GIGGDPLQFGESRKAVHARQSHVEENDIGGSFGGFLQAGLGGRRHGDAESFPLEGALERPRNRLLIVDNQHGGHAGLVAVHPNRDGKTPVADAPGSPAHSVALSHFTQKATAALRCSSVTAWPTFSPVCTSSFFLSPDLAKAASAARIARRAPSIGQFASWSPPLMNSARPANSGSRFGQSKSSTMPGTTLPHNSRHTLRFTFGSPRSRAAASWAALIV